MAVCTGDFELGTNGSNILTTDPGSATAWDTKQAILGNTLTYSSTQKYGTLAAKIDNNGNAASGVFVGWSTALGTVTDHFGRGYFYFTANPGADFRIVQWLLAAASAGTLRITSAGKFGVFDVGGVQVGVTSASISLNQWVRYEWHMIHSATVGQAEIKLFNNPDSATETETITTAANKNFAAAADQVRFGINGTSATVCYMDNLIEGAAAYPGPATVDVPTANLSLTHKRRSRATSW